MTLYLSSLVHTSNVGNGSIPEVYTLPPNDCSAHVNGLLMRESQRLGPARAGRSPRPLQSYVRRLDHPAESAARATKIWVHSMSR